MAALERLEEFKEKLKVKEVLTRGMEERVREKVIFFMMIFVFK